MPEVQLPEVWQRGPVIGIPSLLQPVAHAILQAKEEILNQLQGFPENLIWEKPGGVASIAFHVQHITGVLNRLFTYAKGDQLSQKQLETLKQEGKINENISVENMVDDLSWQIERSLEQLRNTAENNLLEARGIGRKQIPTNVLGLLFHAAEHTTRHTGQLLVTARILIGKKDHKRSSL